MKTVRLQSHKPSIIFYIIAIWFVKEGKLVDD